MSGISQQEEIKRRERMERLLDCPFCGGHAESFHKSVGCNAHGESSDAIGVQCDSCGASISDIDCAGYKVDERKNQVILNWNRRAEADCV